MQYIDGQYLYSATDLVGYLECVHLTGLDFLALGNEGLRVQRTGKDESTALIARKGTEHELAYLQRLRDKGLQVVDIAEGGGSIDDKVQRTQAAMASRTQVIFQATLRQGPLYGHADFLMRVEGRASQFGDWSYEVADTKLARSPKAKFLIQLAFYSHLLTTAQGMAPHQMHVYLGDGKDRALRFADYEHYFNMALARFMADMAQRVAGSGAPSYPEPCAQCAMCHWRLRCDQQRLDDDHLSQVANITRQQREKLSAQGITTMAQLAALPADKPVRKMHTDTLARLREQAGLQDSAKRDGQRRAVVLPLDPERRRGFFLLPQPNEGDMFFDMEGDPLQEGGLEYLFGIWYRHDGVWDFLPFWAHDRADERVAFEQFMDFVQQRRRQFPGAHVYHYASYEETALKRLACQHGTREQALDEMLRHGVLVDLYKVVRGGIRISEPSYSIKYVEHFYRPAREGEVQDAGASIVYYDRWRETQEPQYLQDIARYNRDDVESTWQLRDWLLSMRPPEVEWKTDDRPQAEANEAPQDPAPLTRVQLAEQRLAAYAVHLWDALPAKSETWSPEQHIAALTFQLLGFHRRADKPALWELYARKDRFDEEFIDDAECLGGLTMDPAHPPKPAARSTIYTYKVPPQETKLSTGDDCVRCDTAEPLGPLTYDEATGLATIKLGPTKSHPPPQRLNIGPAGPLKNDVLVDAVYRFADSVISGTNDYPALMSLLQRDPPRLEGWTAGQPIVAEGEDLLAGSIAAAQAMDRTCLYVQGPPGSGKTYTGSRMIAALLARGLRIGITSNSHKAINHLLAEVMKVLDAQGQIGLRVVKKCSAQNADSYFDHPIGGVSNITANDKVWEAEPQLVGGTAWLFADPETDQQLDMLFVDEAGQVSLANLVAAGTSARNIVLLGDQMQLSQPVQGVHPGRSGDSALDYLLDGAATIAPDRGIFLATSYRMHPDVCRFISDAVYDGRLEPEAGNHKRHLVTTPGAHPLLRPAGIVHAPVDHEGCSQGSQQEAELVCAIYASALQQHYTDKRGAKHPMTPDNILVVAPYNVQVNLLRRQLPRDARVGTVDKFQGQEAELIIVSMTTSSEEDLPRNIEFLYSKNRLNVAISRAKCLAIVIANPRLMTIKCQTPEQMALVNLLCWVGEVGRAGKGARLLQYEMRCRGEGVLDID